MAEPAGAVIEIVERRRTPLDPDSPASQVIVPNEVRINGQPLRCSAAHPVTVHEISITDRELVLVTITLMARRVFIGAEGDEGVSDV